MPDYTPYAPTLYSPANGATGQALHPVLQFYPELGIGNYTSQYQYQVDNNSDFSSPVESTIVSGSWNGRPLISRTVQATLAYGTTYYWRVRTWTWTGTTSVGPGPYSASRYFTTQAAPPPPPPPGNSPPDAPFNLSPAGGALVTTTTPTLTFTTSDPEGDLHTEYTYAVASDPNFDYVVETGTVSGGFSSGQAYDQVVATALTPGTTYYWRVKTKDLGSGSYGPYAAAASFVVNSGPYKPTLLDHYGNGLVSGADLTPGLSVLYADPNGHSSHYSRVQVATDPGMTSLVYDSGLVVQEQAHNTTMVVTCAATLSRGGTYYWRVYVTDAYDFISPWSDVGQFRINSLPVATLLTPNNATGKLAKMVMAAGAGWASPRMEVSWSYSDAQGDAQSYYELEIVTDNAGAPTGTVMASGQVASGASTATPTATYAEDTRYHVRVRVYDGLEWSAWSGYFICRARWGLATFAKDVNISGAAPTSWLLSALNATTGATSALTVEYNSSDNGTTNLGAWKADLSLPTKRKWVHYRVWFFAWGTSPATRPQLLDLTIQASGFVVQPDFWLPSPISGEGGSIDKAKYVFGTQSLKMVGDGTEQLIRVQLRVEPNTDYMLQGRIESVGDSGATWRLADAATGASILDLVTPLTVDTALTQYVIGPWNSGSRTAVWLQARINGSSSTAAFFDAVELEKGRVASAYRPSPLGSSPGITGSPAVFDSGGAQVDASAGGVARFRGSGGALTDVVELGVHGWKQGGVEGALVPSGVIVMWSGQTTTIPTGWLLCDGTSGTPDLRDRFIIGASTADEGTSGGTVSPSAALAYTNHQHSLPLAFASPTSYRTAAYGTVANRAASGTFAVASGAPGNVFEDATSSPYGAADHAIPKFYRLAFIMKS